MCLPGFFPSTLVGISASWILDISKYPWEKSILKLCYTEILVSRYFDISNIEPALVPTRVEEDKPGCVLLLHTWVMYLHWKVLYIDITVRA